jgi:hypothetical protein
MNALLRKVRVDYVALFVALAVALVGYMLVSNERDNRLAALAAATDSTRVVACGSAQFGGALVDYFDGSLTRLDQRIGSKDELSTDKAARKQLVVFLDASKVLTDSSTRVCGPLP